MKSMNELVPLGLAWCFEKGGNNNYKKSLPKTLDRWWYEKWNAEGFAHVNTLHRR